MGARWRRAEAICQNAGLDPTKRPKAAGADGSTSLTECWLADVERDLSAPARAEGRSRAKAQGKHMGRPPALTAPTERGRQTARAGRYVAGIGEELQCEQGDDFAPRRCK
jgi:hypothetical protein